MTVEEIRAFREAEAERTKNMSGEEIRAEISGKTKTTLEKLSKMKKENIESQ